MRALSATLIAALSAVAIADQITLHATKDNTLYEDANGALSNGKGDGFFVGRTGPTGGGAIRRGVLAFDLSAIPPGATVISAQLELECTASGIVGSNVSFHRLLADWGEGGSVAPPGGGGGAPAQPGDATWIHEFFPASPWSASGGDFAPVASGAMSVTGVGTFTVASAGMTADVQAWVSNSASNFGWCALGDETAQSTSKRFATHESLLVADQPELRVTYFTGTQTYCTGKINSAGCLQQIGYGGTPSASSGSGFNVVGLNVRNQRPGILAYTNAGRDATPFAGGWRCIQTPVARSIPVQGGGAPLPVNDCSGFLLIDMNAFASGSLGGNPAAFLTVPGTIVNCQYWGRDQAFAAPDNLSLTDALEYLIGP